jgi:thiamine-phosphate pyrophosphorylase
MFIGGICFITDRSFSNLPLPEITSLVLKAGIRFVQYRDKNRERRDIFEEALKLRELTKKFSAALIINDHTDIALAVNADGVHLGQDDLPLKEARKVMKDKIIGISTHNLGQAKEAEKKGADYIGFGPVFHTTTKDAGKPVGIENLRFVRENVNIPVVAIGGINLDNLKSVVDAGADAVAVATAILKGDINENAKRFINLLKGANL